MATGAGITAGVGTIRALQLTFVKRDSKVTDSECKTWMGVLFLSYHYLHVSGMVFCAPAASHIFPRRSWGSPIPSSPARAVRASPCPYRTTPTPRHQVVGVQKETSVGSRDRPWASDDSNLCRVLSRPRHKKHDAPPRKQSVFAHSRNHGSPWKRRSRCASTKTCLGDASVPQRSAFCGTMHSGAIARRKTTTTI